MTETTILIIVGLLGFTSFLFGAWLFSAGKKIERGMSKDYTTKTACIFQNYWVYGAHPWPFGRLKNFKFWSRHSTRPLAVLCIVTGAVLLLIAWVGVFS